MFKIVLLSLALTGLQALPISRRLTKTHQVQDGLTVPLREGFRQGTEPSRRFIVDLNTGLVQDYVSEMNRRTGLLSPSLGNGHGEMSRKHWFTDNTAEEVLVQKNGGGWVRVEHAKLPDGFRQGTEPAMRLPDGYRQGTERFMPIPDGFRQGTEPSARLQDGFRQGTEPSLRIQNGFRQGTERFMPIPDGFRQGTEPSLRIQNGFRQGTERFMPLPRDFRQGTEPSQSILKGFRQGTEPTNPESYKEAAISFKANVMNAIPSGFRQGTEPSNVIPDGFRQGTERFMPIPEGFRQGTEPSQSIPDGFRQGTEPSNLIPHGFRQGTEWVVSLPSGFRQGTEPANPADHRYVAISLKDLPNQIIEGFRPGVGPFMPVRDGNRQETFKAIPDQLRYNEAAIPVKDAPAVPSNKILEGFRPGAGPFMPVRDGSREDIQGIEPANPLRYNKAAISVKDLPAVPSNQILEGFRPGVGPFMPVRDGSRQDIQGIEPANQLSYKEAAISVKDLAAVPSNQILDGFRPGAGPFMPVRDGNIQDIQPSNHIHASFNHKTSRQRANTAKCNGEIINGRCYTFNPTPMPFLEAQDSCKSLHPNADLAAVTNEDLHSRLVSMVTKGGQRDPVMTWLGGTVKSQRGSWLDGSEWKYSDWMPGQPNIHSDKPVCVEMFRMDETWWTAADCDLKRASICSYPVA